MRENKTINSTYKKAKKKKVGQKKQSGTYRMQTRSKNTSVITIKVTAIKH